MLDKMMEFAKANSVKILIVILIVGWLITIIIAASLNKAALDNRPRWMMGGLRDDTGSHNAKDVYGMGFGLD